VESYRNRKFDEDITMLKDEFDGNEGLARKLKSSVTDGLLGDDFAKRDQAFGDNKKEPPRRSGFWRLFLDALDDLMLKVLIVCAFVSMTISMIFEEENRSIAWIEGGAILLAVLIVSGVTAWNDYKKEEQFLKLNEFNEAKNVVTTMRNGRPTLINFSDIKVGDVVQIKPGMNIPCDAILLRGSGVMTDESAMTGESIELKKGNLEMCLYRLEEFNESEDGAERGPHEIPSPVLLSGTQIQTGEGWFMVVVVGKNSCVGKIMAKLNQEVEMTPLQEKLEQIANDIGLLGTYAAAITVIVLFIRFFIEQGMIGFNWGENIGTYLEEWFRYLIVGVTIIVVAVPEGLPLAVIISLAYSVRKMLADMNFVKRLAACEIMGGANNICSDKTGTLTKNQMTVTNVWQGKDYSINVESTHVDSAGVLPNDKYRDLFIQGCACNTVGDIGKTNATEEAILKMLNQFQINFHKMRGVFLPEPFVRFQFTSRRKKMSTVLQNVEDSESGYPQRLHTKGAAEIVLRLCTHYIDENGDKVELTDEIREDIVKNTIEKYAKNALRTICLAYRDLEDHEGGATHENDAEDGVNKEVELNGLICLGIIGIRDVIRPEVPDAIHTCQKAGIRVRMVTGDNKVTALAIAKECQLISNDHEDAVLEGPEFYKRVGGLICENCKEDSPCSCPEDKVKEIVKNKQEFIKIYHNLTVLARSRPEDKYLLVTGIKEMGDTVAVTGDGTNDAPALKKADVGFAMGITGTDVAKHAADIILLDDNFSSIVKACMWGRNIYANIRRFLQFQLTVNIVALVSAFIGSCILRESPLKPIQLLWVNMIMDSLASLALATEPPKPELLEGPPYRRDEYIISRKMVKHILIMAIYQSAIVFTIVFAGEKFIPEDPNYPLVGENGNIVAGRSFTFGGDPLYSKYEKEFGPSRHYTVVFTVFVMLQVFNMLNARKINDEPNIFSGIGDNSMFLVIWIGIFIIQILITQFTADVFMVCRHGLTLTQWAICLTLGLSTWLVDFIIKFIPDSLCPELGKKRRHIEGDERGGVMALRKNYTKSLSRRMPSRNFDMQ
jgi:P-type Ca2+ transporter type 2B